MNRVERLFAFVFGDGHVANPNSNHPEWNSNCRISFNHGPTQNEYLKWKIDELRKLGFEIDNPKTKNVLYAKKGEHQGKYYVNCHAKTKVHRLWTEVRRIAYPNMFTGEKEYNINWLNTATLDSYALAIWWMDDGNVHKTKRQRVTSGYLNTNTTEQEAILVKAVLEAVLRSEVKIHKKKDKFVHYFPPKTFVRMMRMIHLYVHKSMLYKCSMIMGEDNKPIIPTSAEQLVAQIRQVEDIVRHSW